MEQEKILTSNYVLSQTFFNHSGAARTVDIQGDKMVSGGIDKKVVLYERVEGKFEKKSEFKFFKDYVFCVKIMEGGEQFMVGCKDKNIYICSFDDTEAPMLMLEGHEGAVNSLDQSDMMIVSGSWDATAKIWDLESGECMSTLSGHAYAVSVCILENGAIATGSQDGNLHLWDKDGKKIASRTAGHSNIIREIIEVKGIGLLTCSNDSNVKLWSAQNLEEFGSWTHHDSFVFAMASLGGSDFVSGGEDFVLKIFKDGKVHDEDGVVAHPNTVWSISVDNSYDQDLITACGDGIVRVFTRDPSRQAPEDEIESLANEAKMAKLSNKAELDQKTIMGFDTVDKMSQIRGKKEGEIRVFRHGMEPKAYMWKGGKWEMIGDVMGQQEPKKKYEGDKYFPAGEYDYIFNVMDDSGMNKRLPFNEGDNSLVAAEKFLAREGMNVGFKEQIIGFIAKNTRGGGRSKPKPQISQPQQAKLQPIREKKFWRKMNLDGLQKKMLEINQEMRDAGAEEALTDNDVKHLKTLLVKLRDPKIYNYIKEFTSFEGGVLMKILKWPGSHFIPVLDLMRIFVTHHASQAFFSGLDSGISIIVAIASKLKSAPKVIWKIYFKFLCNMCMFDSNNLGLVKGADIIFDSFAFLDTTDAKVMVIAADYFMTVSSEIDVVLTADDKLAARFVNTIAGFFSGGNISEPALLKLSIAVINFAVLKPGCRGSGLTSLAQVMTDRLKNSEGKIKDRLIACLAEIVGN